MFVMWRISSIYGYIAYTTQAHKAHTPDTHQTNTQDKQNTKKTHSTTIKHTRKVPTHLPESITEELNMVGLCQLTDISSICTINEALNSLYTVYTKFAFGLRPHYKNEGERLNAESKGRLPASTQIARALMPNLFARKIVSSDQRPHPAPNSTTTKSRIVLVYITKR